jgi:hypothetical protein
LKATSTPGSGGAKRGSVRWAREIQIVDLLESHSSFL